MSAGLGWVQMACVWIIKKCEERWALADHV